MSICNWKQTHIFPNEYLVSDIGEVKSLRTNKILKPNADKDGYLYYVLCVDGNRKTIKAHRLVAMAFIDNPSNKPAIDHINGDKKDNRVSNLRWVTNLENTNNPNTLHKVVNAAVSRLPKLYAGAEENNFNRKEVRIIWDDGREELFPSLKMASRAIGKNYSKLSEIINGKRNQDSRFTAMWAAQ